MQFAPGAYPAQKDGNTQKLRDQCHQPGAVAERCRRKVNAFCQTFHPRRILSPLSAFLHSHTAGPVCSTVPDRRQHVDDGFMAHV